MILPIDLVFSFCLACHKPSFMYVMSMKETLDQRPVKQRKGQGLIDALPVQILSAFLTSRIPSLAMQNGISVFRFVVYSAVYLICEYFKEYLWLA
jgi:hypothetical protein